MFWNDVDDEARVPHFPMPRLKNFEFIENPYTRSLSESTMKIQTTRTFNSTLYKDKIVKIIVRQKSDQLQFEKFIDKIHEDAGCIAIEIVENFAVDDEDVNLTSEECEDTLTYLNKYIDDSDFDLDKDIVKRLMRMSTEKHVKWSNVSNYIAGKKKREHTLFMMRMVKKHYTSLKKRMMQKDTLVS